MSGTKSTAPETLEELRQAVRDVLATTTPDPDGKAQTAESALHEIAALLPPAPEPIKVGDRVRSQGNTLGSVTDVGPLRVWWDGLNHLPPETIDDERAATLTRVDSSPSPEVGEGWRRPVDMAEAWAAGHAGVLEVAGDPGWVMVAADRLRWDDVAEAQALGHLRVPSGWAEGRELVPLAEAEGRYMAGQLVVAAYTAGSVTPEHDSVPADCVELHGPVGRYLVRAVDGKVWVDPLPKQPDVGEGYRWLATAEALEEAFRTPGVAVSYTNDRLDGRWDVMGDDTPAVEGAGAPGGGLAYWCRRWINAGHTWRASVPGYGETGGAS